MDVKCPTSSISYSYRDARCCAFYPNYASGGPISERPIYFEHLTVIIF
jgi:hypothetical protein